MAMGHINVIRTVSISKRRFFQWSRLRKNLE
jgi:hypothetical protein